MAYPVSILLICFLIHQWDVFYQLLGSSWLCPSLCSLAESSISLKHISQGERCISLSIPINLKYCCLQQFLRKSRKKTKSEYLLDEKLFKNICSLLYVNLVSMKRAVFACQEAECMAQEWSVVWLALTGWSGECGPLCAMHGELHGPALHCLQECHRHHSLTLLPVQLQCIPAGTHRNYTLSSYHSSKYQTTSQVIIAVLPKQ